MKLFKEVQETETVSFDQIYQYRIPVMKSLFSTRFFLTRSWYLVNISCNFFSLLE